jgi:hypothetical protein
MRMDLCVFGREWVCECGRVCEQRGVGVWNRVSVDCGCGCGWVRICVDVWTGWMCEFLDVYVHF